MSNRVNGNSQEAQVTRFATATESGSGEDGRVIIGRGTRVKGTVTECRVLDVYGVLEADVISDQLIVHDGGGVRGQIQTGEAEIYGVVEGLMTVQEHVNIYDTAQITADLTYKTMNLDAGGLLSGNLQVNPKDNASGIKKALKADVVLLNGVEHPTLQNGERLSVVA